MEHSTCSEDACTSKMYTKGLCRSHYWAARNSGRLVDGVTLGPPRPNKVCSVESCGRPHAAKGLCHTHRQWQKAGKPLDQPMRPPQARNDGPCAVAACDSPSEKRGMCDRHYQRWQDGVPLEQPLRFRSETGLCEIMGCSRSHYAKRLCKHHYKRSYYGVDLHADLKPGWRVNDHGYVEVRLGKGHPSAQKSGYALEHRLVMEEMLGRPLMPGENVHHLNGSRSDNRPENLELWATMQPTGQRAVDLLAYADEIYARYGHLAEVIAERDRGNVA